MTERESRKEEKNLLEMIALASYEEENGKHGRNTARYYRSDYIALRMIGTFFASTVGYLLALMLFAAGNAETILEEIGTDGFSGQIRTVLVIYAVLLAVSLIGTFRSASGKHRIALSEREDYRRHLEHLRTMKS